MLASSPLVRIALVVGLLTATTSARAQDAVVPGEPIAPHPTLEHLSIEWPIGGDDNANSVVAVRFREAGATEWRDALPLYPVRAGSNEGFSWATRHAGSLFSLEPATTYEVELSLSDPDGGNDTRLITATTRPVPAGPSAPNVVAVDPSSIDAALANASPGDVLELAAGTYPSLVAANDGTADQPIVLRGSSVDDVIVDGEIRLDGRSHVHVEDVSILGRIKLNDTSGIVIRGCQIQATTDYAGSAIVSYGSGTTDSYVADNLIVGTTSWSPTTVGASGDNLGEGIELTGPGNVIVGNVVAGFRDCVSLLEDGEAVDQRSVDILRNDLDICADDAVEADFAMGNVRVVGNRIRNSFVGLSSQPSLGGPTYFVRNAMYNVVFNPFKLNRGSVGDLALHNTVVKPGDALGIYAGVPIYGAVFRNNLFLGGVGGAEYNGFSNGTGRVLHVPDVDVTSSSFDYDGFGSIGTGTFEGTYGPIPFSSLAELQSTTTEQNAVEVDLSVFAAEVAFPDPPFPAREPADLRLAEAGAAIDRGLVLPNINDGYAGAAPDLGAYELGSDVPGPGPGPGPGAGGAGTGGSTNDGSDDPSDGGGCGCTTPGDRRPSSWSPLLILIAVALRRRSAHPRRPDRCREFR